MDDQALAEANHSSAPNWLPLMSFASSLRRLAHDNASEIGRGFGPFLACCRRDLDTRRPPTRCLSRSESGQRMAAQLGLAEGVTVRPASHSRTWKRDTSTRRPTRRYGTPSSVRRSHCAPNRARSVMNRMSSGHRNSDSGGKAVFGMMRRMIQQRTGRLERQRR